MPFLKSVTVIFTCMLSTQFFNHQYLSCCICRDIKLFIESAHKSPVKKHICECNALDLKQLGC